MLRVLHFSILSVAVDKVCKQCKLAKRVKKLEAELAELKAKVDGHVGHYVYPYQYTYTYPYTYQYPLGTAGTYINPVTWTSGITYTNDGNGGTSEG